MRRRTRNNYIRKIIGIVIVAILLSGIGVLAVHTQLEDVKIELQNGYEMNVLTSSKKVSDILTENNIILQEDEKVTPDLNEEITPRTTIKITNKTVQEIQVAKISEEGVETSIDELLESYAPITEKIITEQEPIPFETITKTATEGSEDTTNKVIQEGQEGIKQVTYKVKYQNDQEIERTFLSEEVIKEPVNKIIQVDKKVTARAAVTPRTASVPVSGEMYVVTAYCGCSRCCGKSTGITASGARAVQGVTVAAPAKFAFGTKLNIGGNVYTVQDRGGAIQGNRIDIYFSSHQAALAWGRRTLPVSVM